MSDTTTTGPTGPGTATAGPTAQQLADQARQVAAQAQQAGTQAVDHAKGVAQEAMSRGSALAGDVTDRVASAADAQKSGLADRLEGMARAVHRSGEQLEGHQDQIAHLVERGAAELEVLARTFRTNDLRGLMGNLQDLARRQPALFVGASLAAGFALARVGRVAVAGASRADLPQVPAFVPEAGLRGEP